MTTIKELLTNYAAEFNARLNEFFPISTLPESRVVEAMKYSITNGGKRLRPFLVNETGKLFGQSFEKTLRTAVALECLHTYSLIHDDLPVMDNDDLRRGKPTCHKAFDEATAILAGDGLLTYSFEILSDERTAALATRNELISLLAQGAGAFNGMVAGQMLDLYVAEHSKENTEHLIKHIEEMKTGRLITFACEAGAVLGQATPAERQKLKEYSRGIGIAFQIADDILDVEGNEAMVGKKLNKDEEQGKATFVSLYGLEKAKQLAKEYIEKAKDALAIFGTSGHTLHQLADYIITRQK